jgi:hypothetical protein
LLEVRNVVARPIISLLDENGSDIFAEAEFGQGLNNPDKVLSRRESRGEAFCVNNNILIVVGS